MLTIAQAAKILGLSRQRVQQLIAAGYIKARKVGPMWLIDKVDLQAADWPRKPGPKKGVDRYV